MHTYPMFIDGKFKQLGRLQEIKQPFDQTVFAKVCFGDQQILSDAINCAQAATPQMQHLPAHRLADILQRTAQLIAGRAEPLAACIAREAGKPIKTAQAEVKRAVHTFELGSAEALRQYGETIPMDQKAHGEARFGMVQRFPLGVIAAITPFNFPLNLVAHKLAPALAARNTVILKPASQTPVSALMLAEILKTAGLPQGALQVIPVQGSAAEILATDDRIKMLTFTGSPEVGWHLKQLAVRKKVALELGGNAGVIVHSDGDIKTAAQAIVKAGFGYAGQSCISVQRVFVHKLIYKKLKDHLLALTQNLKVGDPLSESTDVASMIHVQEAKRIASWVKEAVEQGGRILCGGHREGSVYLPTILEQTTPEMKVNAREVFAPLITLSAYEDFEEAVQAVDNSEYGLQAGLFTRDIQCIRYAYEKIEVGGLIVGDVPTYRIDHMPYGGVKKSGNAREGVRYAIQEMSEPRLLVIKFQ